MIHGVINVYKERGYTSHDVVAKLRGILKQKKIGHTGTLDPDAQGLSLIHICRPGQNPRPQGQRPMGSQQGARPAQGQGQPGTRPVQGPVSYTHLAIKK